VVARFDDHVAGVFADADPVVVDAEVSRLVPVTCGQITTTARAAARVPMARARLYSGQRHALLSRSRTCHCLGSLAVVLLVVIVRPRLPLRLLRFRVGPSGRHRQSPAAMPAAAGFR
jgi:hypothetical protein